MTVTCQTAHSKSCQTQNFSHWSSNKLKIPSPLLPTPFGKPFLLQDSDAESNKIDKIIKKCRRVRFTAHLGGCAAHPIEYTPAKFFMTISHKRLSAVKNYRFCLKSVGLGHQTKDCHSKQ